MYDAIVVGARCTGSATAMLLARRGYRVLVVDRTTFPSDTISTHWLHEPAVGRLRDWGLLDSVLDSGCPPIEKVTFDIGPLALTGRPTPADDVDFSLSCRRTVLDKILVDATAAAGAEVREQFPVQEILMEDGRAVGIRGGDHGRFEERSRLVIGADGQNSLVARAVGATEYNVKPRLSATYYRYFDDLPLEGMEIYARVGDGGALFPTNDGLSLLVVGWTHDQFHEIRRDLAGNLFRAASNFSPSVAERLSRATPVTRVYGKADIRNYYRTPVGPGWALAGDAGYHKDPITAQGITDAFRDAEVLSAAIDEGLTYGDLESTSKRFHALRDEATLPMYEFTTELAKMEPPTPEQQQLFGALRRNQGQIDRFLGVIAGTVPVQEFFSPENIGQVMSAAAA
jgi:2-polyprenyl-6-methoxyphenol hydroxylase-like FAD-dependent oxidoreductase